LLDGGALDDPLVSLRKCISVCPTKTLTQAIAGGKAKVIGGLRV
jgi:hypothetical protein